MTEELQAGPVHDTADVTVLEESPAPAPDETPAEPLQFSARVLRLEPPVMELSAATPLNAGVAVRIDMPDALWLGEVERCEAGEERVWIIRIRLRHVLRDFETLARLAERFGLPPVKGNPVRSR